MKLNLVTFKKGDEVIQIFGSGNYSTVSIPLDQDMIVHGLSFAEQKKYLKGKGFKLIKTEKLEKPSKRFNARWMPGIYGLGDDKIREKYQCEEFIIMDGNRISYNSWIEGFKFKK